MAHSSETHPIHVATDICILVEYNNGFNMAYLDNLTGLFLGRKLCHLAIKSLDK